MKKFDLSKVLRYLVKTSDDLGFDNFQQFYNNFSQEINDMIRIDPSNQLYVNLKYLIDRTSLSNNIYRVGKDHDNFFSFMFNNTMHQELSEKGEEFFLNSINEYRITKPWKQIPVKKQGCLRMRKPKLEWIYLKPIN